MRALSPTAKLLLATVMSFLTGAGVMWVATRVDVEERSERKEEKAGLVKKAEEVERPVVVPAVLRLEPEESELPEIIDALRASYAGASDLVGVELTPEMVRGLFAKPETQVRLLAAPEPVVEETATQVKLLPRRVVYWRPGALKKENLDAFAAAWANLVKERPLGMVLDLRQVSVSAGYEGAADLLSFFASPESTLFTIQELKMAQRVFRAGRQPLELPSGFPLVVVVHGRTRGAVEVVAEWLATRRGALVLGMPTAGEGWPSREVTLRSGRVLKLPVARVVSPTGQDLGKGPLQPDIVVVAGPVEEAAALAYASAGRVEELVAEVPTRRQQNEAALLREENPELDDLIEKQAGGFKPEPSGPRDIALQRALDVVEAIGAFGAAPGARTSSDRPPEKAKP